MGNCTFPHFTLNGDGALVGIHNIFDNLGAEARAPFFCVSTRPVAGLAGQRWGRFERALQIFFVSQAVNGVRNVETRLRQGAVSWGLAFLSEPSGQAVILSASRVLAVCRLHHGTRNTGWG